MSDRETIAVYTQAAADYAQGFARKKDPDHTSDLNAFLAAIPAGGRVLDLGCGPGHWAAAFRDAGYVVEATDATRAMADLTRERYGIDVRVEPFEALGTETTYDGIWANFSLLHSPRADLPDHLSRLRQALRPGGALHLGMKLGTGEGRDRLGRFFTYHSETELTDLVSEAGFTVTRTRRGSGEGLAGGVETYVILTARA